MKFSKRLGWFGMCLTALIASLAVQVAAAVVAMIPAFIIVLIQAVSQGVTDEDTIMQMSMDVVLSLSVVVSHLMMLLCFSLWYRFGCGKVRLKDVKVKEIFTAKNLLVMVLIGAGMCFLTNFAMNVLYPVIPENIMENYENLMETAGFGVSILPTITAVLIAPFGEEFIFRGVVFYYAKRAVDGMSNKRAAFWIANFIQALFFGIFHFNLIQGTYAFFMGLALGYLAHRFRSILPAMLGHMLINGLSSFAWEPIASLLPETSAAYLLGTVISLAVVIVGFYLGGPAEKDNSAEAGI